VKGADHCSPLYEALSKRVVIIYTDDSSQLRQSFIHHSSAKFSLICRRKYWGPLL